MDSEDRREIARMVAQWRAFKRAFWLGFTGKRLNG